MVVGFQLLFTFFRIFCMPELFTISMYYFCDKKQARHKTTFIFKLNESKVKTFSSGKTLCTIFRANNLRIKHPTELPRPGLWAA